MPTGYSRDPVRSLAATRTGDAVVIRRILFGTLRALCADLGIREGDVVYCRACTSTHLLLATAAGRTVPLERDWARFVQVTGASGRSTARLRPEADGAAV